MAVYDMKAQVRGFFLTAASNSTIQLNKKKKKCHHYESIFLLTNTDVQINLERISFNYSEKFINIIST